MSSVNFLDDKENVHSLNDLSKVIFRPGVYVFVRNDQDEILMVLNSTSNKWEIPGGGLEVGEELVDCGIREVKEETGFDIEITNDQQFLVEKDLAFTKTKKFAHCLNFFYEGKLKNNIQGKQSFAEGEKILEVKFIPIKELQKLDTVFWITSAVEKYLKKIIK